MTEPYATAPAPAITATRAGPVEHTESGGAAPALLALHGGMGGFDQSWLLARALLADLAAFRVIAVSRPGYLGTPQAVGRTPEEQADALAALLDALGLDQAVVAAVSAGGPAALALARRHPARCRGLILVSVATGPLDLPPNIAVRLRMMRWLARIPGLPGWMRRKALRRPEASAARSIRDPELARRTLAHPEAGPLLRELQAGVLSRLAARIAGTENDIRHLQAMAPGGLGPLALPVLVVHGTADRVVPPAHGQAVAAAAPEARILAIPGGEHVALFTHLEEVRREADQFLTALPAPRPAATPRGR